MGGKKKSVYQGVLAFLLLGRWKVKSGHQAEKLGDMGLSKLSGFILSNETTDLFPYYIPLAQHFGGPIPKLQYIDI